MDRFWIVLDYNFNFVSHKYIHVFTARTWKVSELFACGSRFVRGPSKQNRPLERVQHKPTRAPLKDRDSNGPRLRTGSKLFPIATTPPLLVHEPFRDSSGSATQGHVFESLAGIGGCEVAVDAIQYLPSPSCSGANHSGTLGMPMVCTTCDGATTSTNGSRADMMPCGEFRNSVTYDCG